MTTSTHLLGARRFLPLFVTQLLGAFNDNLYKNAMVLYVVYSVYNSEAAEARFSAIESPRPRVMAMSAGDGFFGRSGRRARLPASAGLSLAKPTSSSPSPEMARMQTVIERLKLSASEPVLDLLRVLSPGPAI